MMEKIRKTPEIKAELKRHTHSSQISIEVTFPNGDKDNLWHGIVEYCAKSYSPNEIRKIWMDCQNQIEAMGEDNVPLVFHEMMRELRQAMINRRISLGGNGDIGINVIVESTKEITWEKEKGIVRVTFELPVPHLSEEERNMLPKSFEELTKEVYRPVVEGLANYLAALQFSGFEGPTEGIPILLRHIAEAGKEMIDVLDLRRKIGEKRE